MDSIRQNKVARLIQRDLSEMFQQECKEYTEGAMLSVTAVRVSPDLSYAKIYVSFPFGTGGGCHEKPGRKK